MSDDIAAWLRSAAELDQAATVGPWTARQPPGQNDMVAAEPSSHVTVIVAQECPTPDAEWIADARTRLPAALAALGAVLELCDGVEDATRYLQLSTAAVSTYHVRRAITAALGLAAEVSRG